MKLIVSFKMISAAALLALTIGCASTQTSTQNRESMLVASGFKVITPKTPAQQQKLQNLPPGKVTMIQKGKKTYYIFWKRPTCTRIQRWSGARGADGIQALDPLDRWADRDRINIV